MTLTFTATVEAQRLSAALPSVLPHLAKSKAAPMALTGVGLTLTGDELFVHGSDGQTMAQHHMPAAGTGSAVWTAQSAKAASTWAKTLEGDVSIEGTHLTCGDAEMAVELVDQQYPNASAVLQRWAAHPGAPAGTGGAHVIALDPALLVRFGRTDLAQHPDDKGASLLMRVTGPSSPVYVTFGDHFAGLLAVA